jgi:hypothetical protein
MAIRKRTPKREAQLGFESLSIEGGLLSPEWLSRVAQLAAGSQTEADYRIPKGLNVRDEIGRYWRIAHAHWADFATGRAGNADERILAERFVQAFLRECLGFGSLVQTEAVVIDDRTYPIGFSALTGRVPIVIAPAGLGLDALLPSLGDGARRRSAFGLTQEYLNAASGALWGVASDGATLRILRDNASLTRPAWIEVDLGRMFTEERYADFAALWLLAHETRFGRADQPVTDCALEIWRNAGREEGTRAREHLRRGVEDALIALGQGFVAHPDNQQLRGALQKGDLTTKAYFNQLLRLVYRLIFLLTVEERGLLHPDNADEKAKALYASGYGMRRLRDRSVKRSAHDRFSDLWESTKIVLGGLAAGEPRLGLPALAGIFAKAQCPDLDAARLENRALLFAMFKLSWLREASGLSRVNWRDMGPEELGSVYESLLELVPQITQDGRAFAFASSAESKGNARKTSGSYYTPDSLVQVLLDSALEPVIADTIAKNPGRPVDALLGLSIVDPACGSGHFLLAAARRLAAHVARLQANGTPSAAEYRHALRQVVGRCIYGVDLNLMAVELCKVSLWMEAVEPGLPLTFLNSHIQHGNALLGTTPELMAKGIPDAAWEPIEGDDKKVASTLKKRNKLHANEQQLAWSFVTGTVQDGTAKVKAAISDLESASDESSEGLAKKESQWEEILKSEEYRREKLVADAWCAAFVWPKQPGALGDAAPTNEVWRQLRDGQVKPLACTVKTTLELSEQYSFCHWHLAFLHVFAKGGFDVVLGNPPWERVTLKEKEWFSQRDAEVFGADTGAIRLERIAGLEKLNPALHSEFVAAKRTAAGEKSLLRRSGVYPLCGQGDINTFAVFAELGKRLSIGRAGIVLPTGIVTTETTQDFVAHLVNNDQLVSIFDFDNRSGIFPAVQGNVRFCLVTISRRGAKTIHAAAQLRGAEELRDPRRTWCLTRQDIVRINPNTLTMPLFPCQRDAEIVTGVYARIRCLDEVGAKYPGRWNVSMQRMLHMGDDSHMFRTDDQLQSEGFERHGEALVKGNVAYIPLLEAKLCHQFDHRAGTFDGIPKSARFGTHPATRDVTSSEHLDPLMFAEPRYWVPEAEVRGRIAGCKYLLGFRDAVSAVADSRSLVASIVPPHGAGDTLKFFFPESSIEAACLCAWFNSFPTDYVFRLKSSGAHASFFLLRQLPIPRRDVISERAPWNPGETVIDWVGSRVLELTYTAWALSAYARECGYEGAPFRWDDSRRFMIQSELDAAFFHLYGLSRDDTDYVMDSFPIVRRTDEKIYGEYRTKRVILEIFDEMAEATRTGKVYQTRLDPPPADPSVTHSPQTTNVIALPTRLTKPEPVSVPASIPLPAAVALPQIATDGSWQLPPQKVETAALFALASVIVVSGKPLIAWRARLFAALSIDKQKALDVLPTSSQGAWKKAVGRDSKANWDPTILDKAIDDAVTVLRGRGDIDLSTDGTYVATAKLANNPPNQIYVGRAAFIIEHVAPALDDTQLGKLKALFPVSMQDAPVIAVPA